MTILRASSNADRSTALMAAALLRNAHLVPQKPKRRSDPTLELRGIWARVERPTSSILIQAHSLDMFEEPKPELLCLEGFRRIAGRCRRACIAHAEQGLAIQDDDESRMLAIGVHERLRGSLLSGDRISILSPSPLSPCRIAIVRQGVRTPQEDLAPEAWLARPRHVLVLKLRRDLDRLSVGLDPAVSSWRIGELEDIPAIDRLRALAWLDGRG